jgi:hypothetical protein
MSIRPLSHLSAPILRGGILTRGLVTGKESAIVAELLAIHQISHRNEGRYLRLSCLPAMLL